MLGSGWRDNRIALAIAALAVLAGTPAVLAAAGVKNHWARGGTELLAVVVVAVGAFLRWTLKKRDAEAQAELEEAQARRTEAEKRRADLAFRTEDGCLVLADGDLPLVSDIKDPVVLGVHRAAPVPSSASREDAGTLAGERAPAYIPRDVDAELRDRLAGGGFVLLVGDSTAGKSRAAFEAMTTMFPGYQLIRPSNREAVAVAVTRAAQAPQCVLWLDDLEGYLGTGGLTATQLGRLLTGDSRDHVIIATLRTYERALVTTDVSLGDDAASRVLHDTRQVLDLATTVRVARMFTSSELAGAHGAASDPRIAEALAYSGTYGIAEYLAAGPKLLGVWEDAHNSASGPNARGAALVAAAIDIRRAGHTSPITRTLLNATHEHYLTDPAHALTPREGLDDAWKWATQQRTTTALLRLVAGDAVETGDRVEVFDYLVDTIQRRTPPDDHVPELVVRAAIDGSDPADKDSLGVTASVQGRYALAEYAFRRAWQAKASNPDFGDEDPSTLISRANLANVLGDLGRLEEAEAEHSAVLEARVRVLGADDPSTLTSRANLASNCINQGRSKEAETELRAVLGAYVPQPGDDRSRTLIWRQNLGTALTNLGREKEARAEYRAVTEIIAELVAEQPDSPANRAELANAQTRVQVMKDLERMLGAFESILPDLEKLRIQGQRMQEKAQRMQEDNTEEDNTEEDNTK